MPITTRLILRSTIRTALGAGAGCLIPEVARPTRLLRSVPEVRVDGAREHDAHVRLAARIRSRAWSALALTHPASAMPGVPEHAPPRALATKPRFTLATSSGVMRPQSSRERTTLSPGSSLARFNLRLRGRTWSKRTRLAGVGRGAMAILFYNICAGGAETAQGHSCTRARFAQGRRGAPVGP